MKILDDIKQGMTGAITDAKCKGEEHACWTYSCEAGYIDIWCNSRDDSEVVINQDDDRGREHPLLIDAISNAIPDWDSVEPDYDPDPYSDWVRYYGRI